jgi:hypothetical protein
MMMGRATAASGETPLPFLDKTLEYKLPLGICYPIFAALRANVNWNPRYSKIKWHVDIDDFIDSKYFDAIVEDFVILYHDSNDRSRRNQMARYAANFLPLYHRAKEGVASMRRSKRKSFRS